MAMKINGIAGTFLVPNVNKIAYKYTKFDATMKANVNGVVKTVNVKSVLETAWTAVTQRSKLKACNECFKLLFRKKTLAEILGEGDLTLHCLEPKAGHETTPLPDANTAGRDIGIDPGLLFDPDPLTLICTLIHELAHVGGASTNEAAPPDEAHAAEKTLLSCSCANKYDPKVLGSIKILKTGGPAYA